MILSNTMKTRQFSIDCIYQHRPSGIKSRNTPPPVATSYEICGHCKKLALEEVLFADENHGYLGKYLTLFVHFFNKSLSEWLL